MNYNEIKNHQCTKCNRDKIIIAEEKKCTYRIENPSGKLVCKTQIDGCYIRNQACCDYLIVNCRDKDAYFIELKGSDIRYAISQIDQTLDQIKDNLAGYNCFARIVVTKIRVPDIRNTPEFVSFYKKLRKLGGDFVYKSRVLVETI